MDTAALAITLFIPRGVLSDGSLVFEPVRAPQTSNIVQLQPTQSTYGENPVITSLQDERRKTLGYQVIDVSPDDNSKKKKNKKKVMTREKAIQKVVNMRVENEHMEKKLSKLDVAERNNVKQITKLTAKVQSNRQKINNLCQQFSLKPKDYQTESPIRHFGRVVKEKWTSFWHGVGSWIKDNAAAVTAVGLAVLAIVGILF